MNYSETIRYLFDSLPMFHRIGAAAYKADLSNILRLCELLNHPESKFRSVHVAGTNGKGSVSSMLASVFTAAGYKTGLFTSPHLKDFRERIRINGEMIPEEKVIRFVEDNRASFEEIKPSFFEWSTALAFSHFAEEGVDMAIIETGMGGRLDSTNVIIPELSVITNIGWDHMQFLGDSLEKIAREKAGIIKKGVPVIIGEKHDETKDVFCEVADSLSSPLAFASEIWAVKIVSVSDYLELDVFWNEKTEYHALKLELKGNYQLKNILSLMQAIDQLKHAGYKLEEKHIRDGLMNVRKYSGLQGRWQILNHKPLIIADTAHNKPGLEMVLNQIMNTDHDKLHIVLGMVQDKDVVGIMRMFPKKANYYFCHPQIPRALNAKDLANHAQNEGLSGIVYSSVRDALQAAKERAGKNDLIFIGGSTFVVAEAI
ncbi:MAG: bifunctional folylpolyglutamate synthase/dihydrofolate synthase [Bacteroidetes bacterium]|nr:MAG: bifunctional folylpolyglutamate synthase/dihydrofolate synthase [Bacteroidota bacterium]REK03566.1 MAG: bifunctional folylpolyglutamate synthase/dihydrofolate synthase [Bacteroidota bacterium]REK34858.1 MAG: bifunctional folylpolyglutamate synthase/dihydrofolate synthase [Bacteroidota bacterium]